MDGAFMGWAHVGGSGPAGTWQVRANVFEWLGDTDSMRVLASADLEVVVP
ncbi:hypothetical protein [Anaeromyxobacter oryzae]|nr:hypothetical protein [Anaeromyxobacter oryzae]